MPQYRVEMSPTNRAGCMDTICKFRKEKIKKGELRLGSWFEPPSGNFPGGWKWKHWGCVSGKQIEHIRDELGDDEGEYDWDALDGFDELNDEDVKEKVRRCIKQGHIDPEDFRGDPEMNVLGSVGIRSRTSTALLKNAEPAEPAEPADGGGEDEVKTPKSAKGKGKMTAAADNEEETPNKGVKRTKKAVADEDDTEPPKKKAKAPAKRGKQASVKKDESDVEDANKAPTARAKRAATKKGEADVGAAKPTPAAGRGRSRRAAAQKKTVIDEGTEEEEATKKQKKGRGRGKKAAKDDDETEDEFRGEPESEATESEPAMEPESEEEVPKKRGRGNRRSA